MYQYFKNNEISSFFNPYIKHQNGLKANNTNKENNTGIYAMTVEQRHECAIKGHKTSKKLKKGIWSLTDEQRISNGKKYGSKAGKIGNVNALKVQREQQIGPWFNPELNRKIRQETFSNKKVIFKNCIFDSKSECELALNLHYQYRLKLKNRVSVHFLVGRKEFDFFIKKLKLFIEYHGWDRENGLNLKKYKNKRRRILNLNGFEDYFLLVLHW